MITLAVRTPAGRTVSHRWHTHGTRFSNGKSLWSEQSFLLTNKHKPLSQTSGLVCMDLVRQALKARCKACNEPKPEHLHTTSITAEGDCSSKVHTPASLLWIKQSSSQGYRHAENWPNGFPGKERFPLFSWQTCLYINIVHKLWYFCKSIFPAFPPAGSERANPLNFMAWNGLLQGG